MPSVLKGWSFIICSVFELRKSLITVPNRCSSCIKLQQGPEFQPWRNTLVFVTASTESLLPVLGPSGLICFHLPAQQCWPLSCSSDKPRICTLRSFVPAWNALPSDFHVVLSYWVHVSEYHPLGRLTLTISHERSSPSSPWLSLVPLSCFIFVFFKTCIITICPFIYCL